MQKMSHISNFLSPKLIRLISNSNPKSADIIRKLQFDSSSLSIKAKFLIPNFRFVHSLSSPASPNPNFSENDFNTLCTVLEKSKFVSNSDLENAMREFKIEPSSSLLVSIFKRFNSSPKLVFSLFKWAEKRFGYEFSTPMFNSMLNILAKSGEFKWALMVLLDEMKRGELVSAENLGILMRNYARLGLVLPAVNAFKFANNLGIDVFEELLYALCRYGHVMVASDLVDKNLYLEPNWVPSIDVYNMLLDGWFRVRNVKQVEQLLLRMRGKKLIPGVVTYGILVEGNCKIGLVDHALELLSEMRMDGVSPNGEMYGLLVDALAGVGRLKEALGMLERFLILEEGPTFSTYNSLVRGFCKSGDLIGAGKILRMMIGRGVVPTAMTYNWFFRYYSKHGKVEEGLSLYRKMVESGYEPDCLTFHLMLKMLCEEERLETALQIRKDMRSKGHLLDSDISTMLIDMLCKWHRLEEAVVEFEHIIHLGCVPNYLTYQTLHCELDKKGMHELALKISGLVATILPSNFRAVSTIHKKSLIQKAEVMSNLLKKFPKPGELANRRRSHLGLRERK